MADSVLHKEEGSMPETENKDESTLPSKRKLDSLPVSDGKEAVPEDQPNKTQKLQSLTHNGNSLVIEEKITGNQPLLPSNDNSCANSSIPQEKSSSKAVAEDDDTREGEEEEEDDDGDYEDEEEEEEDNGEAAVVDRKGKGIMVEEEEDDDSDDDDIDSSDGGSELDGDGSELEDDPLAEVDLDNILPSRTRRRAAQPGVYVANDHGNDDDDSDDSDA
ncbi:hypothetical protein P3X46_033699 [Hevea brasiliensis]|uniref:Histone chaperone domain-containing protein n=1 Tax=Hevea brasiliensis TaxID=3981 RepID=A0ABQ9KEQ9_HEVBR|nr:uncharacterized protein LOC110650762 [Hevea brasiliensis]XP_057997333.1 uncharacterized protein LOC110650762 [Hevea brasiliensis]KAJ9132873.1 hypothetical protein P3X46_033699 [Hevea brasiliensis]